MSDDKPNDHAEPTPASAGSRWLRIAFGVAANVAGLVCVVWPVMPKSWHAQEFVGRLFGASQDPSMGIQFMFFWLLTGPLGGLLAYGGTKTATRSSGLARVVALVVVVGGVYVMFWIADHR